MTKPLTTLERRQQRILSTLFKEAEKLGYKVKGEPPYKMSLETGRNTVAFRLRERIKQVRRRLTPEEKTKRYYSNQEWTQERFATGELILSIDTWIGRDLPSEWRDGEQSLEQQIPDVVAVLAVVGPILEEWRLQTEAAERRRREEEMRRYEEKQKRDQDRNRWRRFIEFAEAWREAQLAEISSRCLRTSQQILMRSTTADQLRIGWHGHGIGGALLTPLGLRLVIFGAISVA